MQAIRKRALMAGVQTLLLLVGLFMLLWLWLATPQQPWRGAVPTVDMLFDGRVYRIEQRELPRLEQLAGRFFSGREVAARARVEQHIDQQLEHLFDQVRQRIPDYADWYFSLSGEYTRYGMLALSAAGLVDEESLARRGREILFPEQGFEDKLVRLRIQVDGRVARQAEQARETWLAILLARLEQAGDALPAPVVSDRPMLNLDGMAQRLAGYQEPAFVQRTSLSAVAGVGVAVGPMLARLLRQQVTRGGSRALAARGASRGMARAGSAAGGGALACSPGGPVALGCAVLAGAAAWLITDLALLELDEMRNREALIAGTRQEIELMRRQMQRDLMAAYEHIIDAQYAGMREEISGTFVPVRAVR